MRKIKKDIPSLAGLIVSTSLAVLSNGLVNPTLTNIGSSLAANFLNDFSLPKIRRWFIDPDPNKLNHSIKKLFIKSIDDAFVNTLILFNRTEVSDIDKKQAKKYVKSVQRCLSDWLSDQNGFTLSESEINKFLIERNNKKVISDFILKQSVTYDIEDSFKTFLERNLAGQIELCFGEGLKNPDNNDAWIAFQRMIIEEIRNKVKSIADTQNNMKEDLSYLKFDHAGLSDSQINEIRFFIKELENKKLFEIKIKNSLNQTLNRIEGKVNEVIRITTKTQLTVDELKIIVEKMQRNTRRNYISMYILVSFLILVIVISILTIANQPFNATLKVYGWKGINHNPFNSREKLIIEIGDENKESLIKEDGSAIFTNVPASFKGKYVRVSLKNTENIPYYLKDTLVLINKNRITDIQVSIKGIDKLVGMVVDEKQNYVTNAKVMIAGQEIFTDENGNFCAIIPLSKQKHYQELRISKEGFEPYFNSRLSMFGDESIQIRLIHN